MNFEDPFVRGLAQILLGAIGVALLSIGGLGLLVVIDWAVNAGHGSSGDPLLVSAARVLPSLTGADAKEVFSISAVLTAAIPLALSTVCFRVGNPQRPLNLFGRCYVVLLLVSTLAALVAFLGIQPKMWGGNHDLGEAGLTILKDWSRASFRTTAIYLAALLGLKVSK